jgi:hypothetical protein
MLHRGCAQYTQQIDAPTINICDGLDSMVALIAVPIGGIGRCRLRCVEQARNDLLLVALIGKLHQNVT